MQLACQLACPLTPSDKREGNRRWPRREGRRKRNEREKRRNELSSRAVEQSCPSKGKAGKPPSLTPGPSRSREKQALPSKRRPRCRTVSSVGGETLRGAARPRVEVPASSEREKRDCEAENAWPAPRRILQVQRANRFRPLRRPDARGQRVRLAEAGAVRTTD